jgi:hypothetical protein
MTLYSQIHDLINKIGKYDIAARDLLEEKNHKGVCMQASFLLEIMQDKGKLLDYIDEDNRDIRHFVGSLKVLSEQMLKKNIEKDVVEMAYHESRKHGSGILNVLYEEMHKHS